MGYTVYQLGALLLGEPVDQGLIEVAFRLVVEVSQRVAEGKMNDAEGTLADAIAEHDSADRLRGHVAFVVAVMTERSGGRVDAELLCALARLAYGAPRPS